MTETTKPKTVKAVPSVYVCHSEDWATVVLFSQKLGGMQYALDNGLRFLTAPYGVNLRAAGTKVMSGGQITTPTSPPIPS